MNYKTVYWEDVVEGQALPPISYELSLLRLVAFTRATGLFDYIHYDRDYAQSVGMRDAFIAGPHIEGLFARLLTDWSGPEGIIHSMSLSIKDQSCTNDMLEITGKVARKYQNDQGDYLVDIDTMNIGHALAPHAAMATATMSLPSKTGVSATPLTGAPEAPPAADADLPDFAKGRIGQKRDGSWNAVYPLTEHENLLWCEALEDWNPLYWDQEFVKKSGRAGLVAPPAMGWFFGAGAAVNTGVGYLRPGIEVPEPIKRGLTGQALLTSLREGLIADNTPFPVPEFPEAVMVVIKLHYFIPIRPGDTVHKTIELRSCSPLKRTKVGEGHFMDVLNSCYNQRDGLTKTMMVTMFKYRT